MMLYKYRSFENSLLIFNENWSLELYHDWKLAKIQEDKQKWWIGIQIINLFPNHNKVKDPFEHLLLYLFCYLMKGNSA